MFILHRVKPWWLDELAYAGEEHLDPLRDYVNLALDSSMYLEAATMSSEDLAEAAQVFYEKRQPRFKGR